MKTLKAFMDSMAAALNLQTAEMRTGITLIEAVAADQFQSDLMLVSNTPEGREQLRQVAIEAAKLGIARAEELAPIVRNHYLAVNRLQQLEHTVQRYIKEATS